MGAGLTARQADPGQSAGPVITPAWGMSPGRYESATGQAAQAMGEADWPSPTVALVGPDQRVLDLGCGTGHTARLLSERGCSVVGVEFDEEAAISAGAWCERVVVCDLDIASLGDLLAGEHFDVVVAGDILEHLRDPAALLRSLLPLLAPNATVVASVPNVAHGSVRLALMTGRFDYADMGILDRTHLRFFTRDSLEALFSSAGYTIEKLERLIVDVELGEPYERDALPDGLEAEVTAMPEATTYEFVVVARPVAQATSGPQATSRADPTASGPVAVVAMAPAEAEVLREKDRLIAGLRAQVSELTELRVKLAAANMELGAQRAELESVTGSRVWKAWLKVRPAARAVLAPARRSLSRRSSSSRSPSSPP